MLSRPRRVVLLAQPQRRARRDGRARARRDLHALDGPPAGGNLGAALLARRARDRDARPTPTRSRSEASRGGRSARALRVRRTTTHRRSVSSIAIARTNAIGLRAELSTEVWEHINELYLDVQEQSASIGAGRRGPSRFLRVVRDRCQAIAGVSDATCRTSTGGTSCSWAASSSARSLAARMLATAASFDDPWPEWQRLLEMCCASFPFARAATATAEPAATRRRSSCSTRPSRAR